MFKPHVNDKMSDFLVGLEKEYDVKFQLQPSCDLFDQSVIKYSVVFSLQSKLLSEQQYFIAYENKWRIYTFRKGYNQITISNGMDTNVNVALAWFDENLKR